LNRKLDNTLVGKETVVLQDSPNAKETVVLQDSPNAKERDYYQNAENTIIVFNIHDERDSLYFLLILFFSYNSIGQLFSLFIHISQEARLPRCQGANSFRYVMLDIYL